MVSEIEETHEQVFQAQPAEAKAMGHCCQAKALIIYNHLYFKAELKFDEVKALNFKAWGIASRNLAPCKIRLQA